MGFFSKKNHFEVKGRTILITGGSQGMGKALAQLLASKGANVIIVARNPQVLESALEEIKASALSPSTQRFHTISADLVSHTSAISVLSSATAWNNNTPPSSVICCAGASRPDYFLTSPPETFKTHMETNYLSGAHIAQAAVRAWLPSLVPSPSATVPPAKESTLAPSPPQTSSASKPAVLGDHHIVLVSSIAALAPIPGYTPYAPSKTALASLSQNLSMELQIYSHLASIRPHCVFANTMTSPGLVTENLTKPEITRIIEEGDTPHSPESAAKVTLQRLEAGEENITIDGMMGYAMRCGQLGFARRNGYGVLDTLLAWVVTPFLPVVRWDFEGKAKKFGKEKF